MHIFLSPHFDDAVYSCGGLIHQLSQRGEAVKIITVMAGDPPDPLPDTPLIRELHARWNAGVNPISVRRREDEAAAETLNAGTRHLDIPDCVYRTHDDLALYPEGDADIFGQIHADDPAATLLASLDIPYINCATTLYAPMAIGNHVDHVLVRDWALQHTPTPITVMLYADYPYSTDATAIDTARNAIHPPITLDSTIIPINPVDFEAKVKAAGYYQSQTSTFWADDQAMKNAIYDYLLKTGDGILAERYWRLIR